MWSCDACRFRRNDISASGKLGLLPLPIWGEGWSEGVTGGTDGSEPPHPFHRVARTSSPLPGGERARVAIVRGRHDHTPVLCRSMPTRTTAAGGPLPPI